MDISISIILAFVAAISWGVNSHVMKIGVKHENAMYALFLRAVAASPILLVISIYRDGLSHFIVYFTGKAGFLVVVTSILVVCGDGIFMYSLKKHDVKKLLPISAIYPLITTSLLLVTGVESPSINIILGTLAIIIGVAMVSSNGNFTFDLGIIGIGLIVATFWGTSIYFVRIILENPQANSVSLTSVRTLYMGILGLLIYFILPRGSNREVAEKRRSTLILLMSGIIGWVMGAAVFFEAVDRGGASMATPISSTNPIIAAIIGKLTGLEAIDRRQIMGIVFSVIGTVIIVIG